MAGAQRGVGGDPRAAVHAQRLAGTGDEEQQCHARVGHDVAQRVDPVVAAPVGQHQRAVVRRRHEARRVAARRHVRPVRADGRQQHEG